MLRPPSAAEIGWPAASTKLFVQSTNFFVAAPATSFAIAQVVVMPLTAFLGRFFGQKQVYLFCLGLFLVGSMVCGMARTLTQLVLARALQGLGGGALQPTQQAILRQTFPA